MAKKHVEALTIAERAELVIRAEPKLRTWTIYGFHGFGLYSGANDAIRDRPADDLDITDLASWYRDEVAVLAALRMHSLFDRCGSVSFQTVYRHLKVEGVKEEVSRRCGGTPRSQATWVRHESFDALERYEQRYRTIDLKALGRLQHFRNLGIVHISYEEVEKRITFGELEAFVLLAGDLCDSLTLAVAGLSRDSRQRYEDQKALAGQYWTNAMGLEKGDG